MAITLKPLAEQTIVITGASSGIGLATARAAAEAGARVVLVARGAEALEAECARMAAAGLRADHVVADVGRREEVARVVRETLRRHGGFDTWVNDAGVAVYARLEDTSDEDHHRIFQTNYWGMVYGTLEALKHLKPKGGAIVNLGSIASAMPTPILSAYAASKHAVKGFTDALRLELLHDDAPVALTLIMPSGVDTPFAERARNTFDVAVRVPPPAYRPELVADAILRAAVTPTREIVVGASGAAQIALARLAPRLADRLFSWAFFRTAFDRGRPNRSEPTLHAPGRGGQVRGPAGATALRRDPYTAAQLRPGVAAAAAVVAAGAALWLYVGRRGRDV